ncbi:MAG: M20/M25/M40 family metallo-hydrolase [Armatimonadia bacterium]
MIDSQAMRAEFEELVRIDSLSGQEEQMALAVTRKLEAMGLTVQRDQAGEHIGSRTGNVIAIVPATDPSMPTVMLNAHIDTVAPGCSIEVGCKGDMLCSVGDTILGADDKAGVTIILTALREVMEQGLSHGELQVVFTVAEEIGLHGAQGLDYSLVNPDYALVFDGGREVGSLTVAAPSAAKMTWRVLGLAAHAGVCPEKGVNAVQIAAQAIAAMKIGRIDQETTANIGRIEGGAARNIVPESCEVWGEARSHDEAKLAAQIAHMRQCFQEAVARYPQARLEEDTQSSYRSFHLSEDAEVVQVAARAALKLGLPVQYKIGGGGSDANVFNERGIPAVICATGACDPHTLDEMCSISGMGQAAEWLVGMLKSGRD